MSGLETAGLYVGLFTLFFFILKGNVGRVRMAQKVDLGDGGNDRMTRAIRAQGNAVEDVPILLGGLVILALMDAPPLFIHALGATLFVARVLHFVGITQVKGLEFGRMVGTLLTVIVKLSTGVGCLWFALT